MSSKRQPSKQRRQAQNQKQRAALEARRAAATATGPAASSGRSTAGRGSLLSRLRGTSANGRTLRAGAAGALPVGHRAALSALLAAAAGAVVGSLLIQVPVDRGGDPFGSREALVAEWVVSATEAADAAPEASAQEVAAAVEDWSPGGTKPYGLAYFPFSLAAVLPIIGTGLGFRVISQRAPARTVNRTMYVTLFGALLTSQLLLLFLPAVVSLAVAAFQVRKAELAAAATADGVIDVDEAPATDEVDGALDVEVVDEPGQADERRD